MPPPPPPPPAPTGTRAGPVPRPGPAAAGVKAQPGQLLDAIRGGTRLKPSKKNMNDRSAPIIEPNATVGGAKSAGPSGGAKAPAGRPAPGGAPGTRPSPVLPPTTKAPQSAPPSRTSQMNNRPNSVATSSARPPPAGPGSGQRPFSSIAPPSVSSSSPASFGQRSSAPPPQVKPNITPAVLNTASKPNGPSSQRLGSPLSSPNVMKSPVASSQAAPPPPPLPKGSTPAKTNRVSVQPSNPPRSNGGAAPPPPPPVGSHSKSNGFSAAPPPPPVSKQPMVGTVTAGLVGKGAPPAPVRRPSLQNPMIRS